MGDGEGEEEGREEISESDPFYNSFDFGDNRHE